MTKPLEPIRPYAPRIAALFCNWCTYAGADLAGVGRMQYPADFRVVRVPCTGRISAEMILHAFKQGADGVWVSGCHPGTCHYLEGNLFARRRFALLKNILEYAGLEPGRLHFSWISSSEATKFQETATAVVEAVRALGPATGFLAGIRREVA
jgi:coenzyme F420-reducing hydrogenase delta subunit